MFMEAFKSVLPTILTVVVQAVVAILGVFAISFIKKLITRTGIEIDQSIMDEIEDIVFKAVSATNQTLTDNFKAASDNHKLTDEQIEKVFNNTKDIIMSSLSTKQAKALMDKYGTDVDEAINLLIENTVYWSHATASIEKK